MKKKVTCSLDCFDLCQFEVEVEDGTITRIDGAEDHPLTRGFICGKGRAHLERHNSPDRLMTPMRKQGGEWHPISYEEAEMLIVEHLRATPLDQILFYSDAGHGGLSKEVDALFFSCLGGVIRPRGSLCWAAGIQATRSTFSDVLSTPPDDIESAETIVLWGRNPADTNRHLAQRVALEKQRGKTVVLIDPLRTRSANLSTHHLPIRANTDALLALGIIRWLRDQGRLDLSRIKANSVGWESLPLDDDRLELDRVAEQTGLSKEEILHLASCYAEGRVTTYIGYGLQRYRNGAHIVQAINALSFATFNYGGGGSGVNYGHRAFVNRVMRPHKRFDRVSDTFVMAKFASYVLSHEIQMLMVTKANPMVQLPDLNQVRRAFDKIPFKVGIDLFMTDTMAACDLVLPAPSLFEEEDVLLTSMYSPYLQYSQKVVDNPAIKGEYALFKSLAHRLGLSSFPQEPLTDYLEKAVSPILEAEGMSFKAFREKGWIADRPEGQYAQMETFRFDPRLLPPLEDPMFPLRLITPHHRDSLHSQGFRTVEGLPEVHMSRKVYETWVNSDRVRVRSSVGELLGKVKVVDMPDDLIMIHEGYWHKSGAVNVLTQDAYSDLGEQAAYYDTFVEVRGV